MCEVYGQLVLMMKDFQVALGYEFSKVIEYLREIHIELYYKDIQSVRCSWFLLKQRGTSTIIEIKLGASISNSNI